MNTCDYENVILYLSYGDNKKKQSFLKEGIEGTFNFARENINFKSLKISITIAFYK